MACGEAQAIKLQQFFCDEQYGIKDIWEMADSGLIPEFVAQLGIDFLEFVESFYDEDGNYTEDGISEIGYDLLKKYIHKYVPDYILHKLN